MKCYGIFHGGYSYSPNWTESDVEEFDSIAEAQRAFEGRIAGYDSYYPATDDSASMWLFWADVRVQGNPEAYLSDILPDRVLAIGPRGGLIAS